MKTTKRDWLHFITGAVAAVIVSAAVVDATSQPISEMETTHCNCYCSCSRPNLDDEVIYTMDVKDKRPNIPVGEPPPQPVILSQ